MTIVIGSGMAGLLAAAMLRSDCESVLEAQKSLPNNHSALLRFRTSVVGDTLGIKFKKVPVIKEVLPWRNSIADSISYAKKCTGLSTLRSSISAKGELEQRYIAPLDLIQQMADRVQADQFFDFKLKLSHIEGYKKLGKKIISTMPMPALMKLLGYETEERFVFADGYNINAKLRGMDIYATIYVPAPELPFSRVSITGDNLVIEYPCPGFEAHDVEKIVEKLRADPFEMEDQIARALSLFGLNSAGLISMEVSQQRYSKILPIDEGERHRFIMWATDTYGIYSLGRFATWRPGLLLDDAVKDVRQIQEMMIKGSYHHRKA